MDHFLYMTRGRNDMLMQWSMASYKTYNWDNRREQHIVQVVCVWLGGLYAGTPSHSYTAYAFICPRPRRPLAFFRFHHGRFSVAAFGNTGACPGVSDQAADSKPRFFSSSSSCADKMVSRRSRW